MRRFKTSIQYKMVGEHGTPAEQCAHAGIIAGLYLSVHDEDKYAQWTDIKHKVCAAAGLPNM